jgi:hypothetical protein
LGSVFTHSLFRQGYACPQFHNNKDRRRSPKKFKYRSTPCPNVKTADEWGDPVNCDSGDNCQYCHTRYRKWGQLPVLPYQVPVPYPQNALFRKLVFFSGICFSNPPPLKMFGVTSKFRIDVMTSTLFHSINKTDANHNRTFEYQHLYMYTIFSRARGKHEQSFTF